VSGRHITSSQSFQLCSAQGFPVVDGNRFVDAFDTDAFDTGAFDTGAFDTGAFDPDVFDPVAFDPAAFDPDAFDAIKFFQYSQSLAQFLPANPKSHFFWMEAANLSLGVDLANLFIFSCNFSQVPCP
jgi:hypothetical protein